MPTYRYRCSQCGEEFEQWQSIKDESLHTHDDGCGGGLLKVLTPAGIVLKGSGFYKNDSRSSSRERVKAESSGSDAAKSKDSGGGSPDGASSSESDSGGDTKQSDTKQTDTKQNDTKSNPAKTGDSKSTAGTAKPT